MIDIPKTAKVASRENNSSPSQRHVKSAKPDGTNRNTINLTQSVLFAKAGSTKTKKAARIAKHVRQGGFWSTMQPRARSTTRSKTARLASRENNLRPSQRHVKSAKPDGTNRNTINLTQRVLFAKAASTKT
jgi:hypothetical protein